MTDAEFKQALAKARVATAQRLRRLRKAPGPAPRQREMPIGIRRV